MHFELICGLFFSVPNNKRFSIKATDQVYIFIQHFVCTILEILLLTDQEETNENESNEETNKKENAGDDKTENDNSKEDDEDEGEEEDEEPMEEDDSSAKEEDRETKNQDQADMETTDDADNENKANPPAATADTDLEAKESKDEKSRENEVESESGKDDTLNEATTDKIEEDLDESDDEEDEDLDFVLKTLKDNEKDPLEDAASTEPGDDAGGNVVGTSELRISTTEDEDTSQTSAVSPFKRPPDSVSVDGSFSNTTTREPSRERHMSVNSIDDQGSESRMSETNSESERRQSANEELAAQYAQQLAFYRYPTFL